LTNEIRSLTASELLLRACFHVTTLTSFLAFECLTYFGSLASINLAIIVLHKLTFFASSNDDGLCGQITDKILKTSFNDFNPTKLRHFSSLSNLYGNVIQKCSSTGRRKQFDIGTANLFPFLTSLFSPSYPISPYLSPLLSLSVIAGPSFSPFVGPLNTAKGRGSAVSSPSGVWGGALKSNLVHFSLKSDIWWHQFYYI